MKKPYVSPVIEVERFVLTQAIASCHKSMIISSHDGACIEDSNLPYHWKDIAASGYFWTDCGEMLTVEAEDMYQDLYGDDGVCYHTNANMAFTSQ